MLTAGAPRMVGDDEERMLMALRDVIAFESPLAISAGVIAISSLTYLP